MMLWVDEETGLNCFAAVVPSYDADVSRRCDLDVVQCNAVDAVLFCLVVVLCCAVVALLCFVVDGHRCVFYPGFYNK